MRFNVSTFLFQVINFVVLAYILHRLLYRPLRAAVDKRRADVNRTQTEAEAARADAVAMQKRLQSELTDVEKQREETMQQARAAAEKERIRLIAESQKEIERRQDEIRTAIARQHEEVYHALAQDVRSAAADLAERLLQESAGTSLQSQLAKRLIDTLAELSAEERARVQRDWTAADGVALETAAGLDSTSVQEINDAVDAIVGGKVKLAMEMKPALLAGVRLRIGGHVWDASLAGQLETLQSRRATGSAQ